MPGPSGESRTCRPRVSRYVIVYVDIYASAHKHAISDIDIEHAVNQSVVTGDQEDGKVLCLGRIAPGTSWSLCRCVEMTELRS